jgi:hypothetical protein
VADFWSAAAGALLGGVVVPILLEKYRAWDRERSWATPRKMLLKKLLERKKFPTSSLSTLSRTTGTEAEACRTLLIELGARGVRMKGDIEGWTLQPLSDAELDEALEDPMTKSAEPNV